MKQGKGGRWLWRAQFIYLCRATGARSECHHRLPASKSFHFTSYAARPSRTPGEGGCEQRGSPRRLCFRRPGQHNQVAPARPPRGRVTIRTATAGACAGGLLPESRPVVALERSRKGRCSPNEGLHILLSRVESSGGGKVSRERERERRGGVAVRMRAAGCTAPVERDWGDGTGDTMRRSTSTERRLATLVGVSVILVHQGDRTASSSALLAAKKKNKT